MPALIGLTIWKYRGLGYLPVLPSAAGASFALVVPLAVAGLNLHKYLPFNWQELHHNLDGLREYTWSQRMIYWTGIAGAIGLARRSFVVAGLAAALDRLLPDRQGEARTPPTSSAATSSRT